MWPGGLHAPPVVRYLSWLATGALLLAIGGATIAAVNGHVARTIPTASTTTAAAYEVGVLNDPAPANGRMSPVPHPPSPTAAPAQPPTQKAPVATNAPRPTVPTIAIRSYQQTLINRDRALAGLRPLTWSSCLASVAAANAVRMARQGFMSHTNGPSVDLGCRLGNQAGENVGWWSGGINDPQLNSMFMNSPEHHANIMGPYRYVGTAWAVAPNGYAYIAVEFG